MENKQRKYGFLPPVIVPEDFWLGSKKLGSIVINEKGDWRSYLPIMEKQNMGFEPNACVSFGTTSALEMIYKLLWKTETNYSDRFVAKSSETDPNAGNTPKKVSETIKKCGNVSEEKYPWINSLNEYYEEIPLSIKEIGKEWLKNYDFGYEWADKSELKEALKRSPVGVAVYAWSQNSKGEYIRLGNPNHWCVLVAYDEQDRPIIWDSYDTGLKTLEKNYNFEYPQIYTLKKKLTEEQRSLFLKILDSLKSILLIFQKMLGLNI